jgi:hypothetical protein
MGSTQLFKVLDGASLLDEGAVQHHHETSFLTVDCKCDGLVAGKMDF